MPNTKIEKENQKQILKIMVVMVRQTILLLVVALVDILEQVAPVVVVTKLEVVLVLAAVVAVVVVWPLTQMAVAVAALVAVALVLTEKAQVALVAHGIALFSKAVEVVLVVLTAEMLHIKTQLQVNLVVTTALAAVVVALGMVGDHVQVQDNMHQRP